MRVDPADIPPAEVYKLMTATIVPRPIAFVSTVSADGIPNLAPYSFFTGICYQPPTICFSAIRRAGQKKDTVLNIESTGDFVINVVDEAIAEAMNATSADFPREINEFESVGLVQLASEVVRPPRVGESPVSMECRLVRMIDLGIPPNEASLIIGEVLRFHIREDLYVGSGKIDVSRLQAVGRLVGDLYCHTNDTFAMPRPQYHPKG